MGYLISIIVFQALFSFFLFITHKKRDGFEQYLMLFLFLITCHFLTKLGLLLYFKEDPTYYELPTSYGFFYGPMVWLMARILAGKKKYGIHFMVHMLPFVVASVGYVIVLFNKYHGQSQSFEQSYGYLSLFQFASLVIYPVLSLVLLSRSKKTLDVHRKKLIYILTACVLADACSIFTFLLLAEMGWVPNFRLTYVWMLCMVIAILLYKMRTYEVPKKIGSGSYASSNLDAANFEDYGRILEDYFKKERPFLDPDLTLQSLSQQVGVPKHHLTQVLNIRFQKNFYQYVNEHRIKEILKKMEEEKGDYKITDLAFECGFQSKSTFNSYFKKITGKTPSEFRKANSFSA